MDVLSLIKHWSLWGASTACCTSQCPLSHTTVLTVRTFLYTHTFEVELIGVSQLAALAQNATNDYFRLFFYIYFYFKVVVCTIVLVIITILNKMKTSKKTH